MNDPKTNYMNIRKSMETFKRKTELANAAKRYRLIGDFRKLLLTQGQLRQA